MSAEEPAPRGLGRAAEGARAKILELIEAGVYPGGSKLPGERELAVAVGVSRTVLRDALSVLADEHRIEASPWRGWFVTGTHMQERVELQSFTSMALERGLRPGAVVLSSALRDAAPEEARLLRLAPGEEVFEMLRLRTLNDRPACVDRTIIPTSRAAGVADIDFTDASLYERLETACGIIVVRSDYTVKAEGASGADSAQLGLAEGAPVLVGEEIAAGVDGVPIALGRVVYRNDAYEFQATLFRPASA
ncbi:GntR family transcriptional regulator [Leucobacter iarius]|uniref:Phosphonate utilization transcriptional regulator PhnR n=1 Tax=Leucobacter iarius TaxID=333963 RepID=A0ABP4XQ82_9MICO